MKKFWQYISDKDIKADSQLNIIHNRLINQYAFILPLIFLTEALRDLFLGLTLTAVGLFQLSALFLVFFFFTQVRFHKPSLFLGCLFTALLIFYYSSIGGYTTEIALYYFVLLQAVLFLFNKRADIIYTFLIYFFVFILFFISYFFSFKLFDNNAIEKVYRESNQLLLTILQVGSMLIIQGYITIKKNILVNNLYEQKRRLEELVEELDKKVQTSKDKNEVKIEDVVQLAMQNDISFIPVFKMNFPDFYDRLLEINPAMTAEEFKFCTLLKLGFSTKDISTYNHITVRSVQTRKSRLRKSFTIPSELDLYTWIETL